MVGSAYYGLEHDQNGNVKSNEPVESDAPGASLFVEFKLKPGEEKIIRTMMAWYVPDTNLRNRRG